MNSLLQRFVDIPDAWFKWPGIIGATVLAIVFCALPGSALGQAVYSDAKQTQVAETPRIVSVEVAEGKFLSVRVFNLSCVPGQTGGWATLDNPTWPAVYLCGHLQDEMHELAHWKGMRHTAWDERPDSRVSCATIIAPGYGTVYKLGDRICMTRDTRFEWIDKRGAT